MKLDKSLKLFMGLSFPSPSFLFYAISQNAATCWPISLFNCSPIDDIEIIVIADFQDLFYVGELRIQL